MRRILGFFWFLLIVAAVLGYSLYLDHAGIVTSGKVSDKHEAIFVHAGNWNRSLQMVVRFQVPGEPLPRYAQGNVDTSTYDRARIGDAMQVRYLPSPLLHQIVIIPTSRLASNRTFSLPSACAPAPPATDRKRGRGLVRTHKIYAMRVEDFLCRDAGDGSGYTRRAARST